MSFELCVVLHIAENDGRGDTPIVYELADSAVERIFWYLTHEYPVTDTTTRADDVESLFEPGLRVVDGETVCARCAHNAW